MTRFEVEHVLRAAAAIAALDASKHPVQHIADWARRRAKEAAAP